MGKIFCLIGKSGVGKDTILNELMKIKWVTDNFKKLRYHTTRPMRANETPESYFFHKNIGEADVDSQNIIDLRYYAINKDLRWYYFTLISDIDPDIDYMVCASDDQYVNYINSLGSDRVVPIYIEINPYIRLMRKIERLKLSPEDKLDFNSIELCRRFAQDEIDYDRPVITEIPERNRVFNYDLQEATNKVIQILMEGKSKK